MKILLYSFDYHPCPGGVNTFINELKDGLYHRGHTVDFLNSSHIKFLPKNIISGIKSYEQTFEDQFYNIPQAVKRIEKLRYANEQLVKHIDITSYDLVHSNNGVTSQIVRSLVPDIPLFGTIHGIYYRESIMNGWVSSLQEAEFMRVYDQYAIDCPNLVHTVSYSMIKELPYIPENKHIVIYNSVNVKKIKTEFNTHKPIRIAGAGVISEKKGYDLLIKALNLLNQSGINEYEVVLYGDGPMKEILMQESESLQLPVAFRGNVPREVLYSELPKYDIFIHPSRYESFGLSVTEAMASGCAIICTNIGGLTEQIKHEENGLLFELDDAEGLATSILRLIKDHDLRNQLIRRGIEIVKEEFSRDVMLDKFEQAYEKTKQLHSEEKGRCYI